MRIGSDLVGWGVAAAIHPAFEMPATVALRVDDGGGVLVRCGFQEMGMGTATAVAQLAAHTLGVPVDRVQVEYGDTALPVGPMAGGSTQTSSITAGLLRAAERLRVALHRLERRAPDSPLRGTRSSSVRLREGGLYGPAGGVGLGAVLHRAGRAELTVRSGPDTGPGALAGQARFMAKLVRDGRRWVKAASGAQFCEVRVDADTGETRVTRWVGVFDIGRVVNAKLAAGQLRGGIVMGLGMALSEATLVDPRSGRIMNPSLAEYHVPVHADVPPIAVECLDEPDPTMPLGVLGAGEVGITGVAAAVANAVHHATGRRIRDLPITLDSVLP
jgi:xanthine dehydrogenase YagR molybdenum-binding subunit